METNTETNTQAPAKVRRVTKKAAAKKATKKVVSKSEAGSGIPLKTICGQLKIEPRLARRKLRNAELSFHGMRERWTFTPSQATKVKEILRA